MNKKIIFLMCLLMAMVWAAGCTCEEAKPRPAVAAPPPPVYTPPPAPAPQPAVVQPPAEQPAPSKKLKQRVINDTND